MINHTRRNELLALCLRRSKLADKWGEVDRMLSDEQVKDPGLEFVLKEFIYFFDPELHEETGEPVELKVGDLSRWLLFLGSSCEPSEPCKTKGYPTKVFFALCAYLVVVGAFVAYQFFHFNLTMLVGVIIGTSIVSHVFGLPWPSRYEKSGPFHPFANEADYLREAQARGEQAAQQVDEFFVNNPEFKRVAK